MSDPQSPPKNPERHSTYIPAEKKSTKPFHPTPMLDQLESGPWPSFVTGLKRLAHENKHDGRPARPARAFLQDAPGLLERRHGVGVRLRRRHHPAFLRSCEHVPGVQGVPHAARAAAGGQPLHHQDAAPAFELLEQVGFRADRVPWPDRQHHVHRHDHREHPAFLRRDQRVRFRSGRRGSLRAHRHVVRGRGALRAVVHQRAPHPPHARQQLHRRHAPPGAALQVQVQGFGLPERLHELHPARRLRRDRHLARRHAGRPDGGQGVRREPWPQVHDRQRDRALPDQGAIAERRRHARGRQQELRALHALHQRHDQGAQARQGPRHHAAHRRQAHPENRRHHGNGDRAVHEDGDRRGLRQAARARRHGDRFLGRKRRWSTSAAAR